MAKVAAKKVIKRRREKKNIEKGVVQELSVMKMEKLFL